MMLGRYVLLFIVAWVSVSASEQWMDGAFYLPTEVNDARVEELRQGGQVVSASYLAGLLRVGSARREDVFLLGSNYLACYYTMPGELTIERFEQFGSDAQKSRLILHVTEGVLTVDSSALSADSQCIVETPLGRLTAGAGQWTLAVAYDSRTRIYNFTLESIDVDLVFKTNPGDRFVVQAGQMLTGAGASTLPDLEIADLLNSAQDRVQILGQLLDEAKTTMSVDQLRAKLRPIENRTSENVIELVDRGIDGGEAEVRPIVIEYSPRPKPLVPFRGVVKPPSEYQKDLF